MTATRRQAREWAIQMLTAVDLNPPRDLRDFMTAFWDELASLDKADGGYKPDEGASEKDRLREAQLREFAEARVAGVLAEREKIDEILAPLLAHWDLRRLGTVERAVLRMGVWEMMWSDVPKPVVINEAIDLANWFSSPKSRALVNGVLDKHAKSAGQ